ncbi:YggT family protein [Shouchella sp. 1P09AA]|uniref:YggT family protein n=1 Tax=Bacillaceae TaxID=186817 RepID=UPI000C07F372|nr:MULTISPECIES: YggT family protein [Bacillaceae]UTR04839.1 YggT family protein [Alkalihalobacillus sp. LMS6]
MELFVNFIFNLIRYLALGYFFAILIYIIMSWVGGRDSAFGEFLGSIVEPYLGIFRNIIPPIGMIDLSPIVAIFLLNLAVRGLGPVQQWIMGLF